MDVNWQYNNPANPADAAIGPAGYDNHLYYSFGVRFVYPVGSAFEYPNDVSYRGSPTRTRTRT